MRDKRKERDVEKSGGDDPKKGYRVFRYSFFIKKKIF
jgi:hypothetical protein